MPGNLLNRDQTTAGIAIQSPQYGGAKVLLEQQIVNGGLVMDFRQTIRPNFDTYIVELWNLVPQNNLVNMALRFMSSASSIPDSSAVYAFVSRRNSTAGSALSGGSGFTSIDLTGSGLQSNSPTTGGLCGWFQLFYSMPGVMHPRIRASIYTVDNTGTPDVVTIINGAYRSIVPITGLQFLTNNGALVSGFIRTFGMFNGS